MRIVELARERLDVQSQVELARFCQPDCVIQRLFGIDLKGPWPTRSCLGSPYTRVCALTGRAAKDRGSPVGSFRPRSFTGADAW